MIAFGWGLKSPGERARFVRLFEPRLPRIKNGAGAYAEILANFDRSWAITEIQRPSLRAWLRKSR